MRVVPLRYRLDVAARVAAALAGGYGLAVAVAIAGTWALPLPRFEAATVATGVALLAWPAAAMACFRARSAGRAWAGLLLAVAACAALALAGGWRP